MGKLNSGGGSQHTDYKSVTPINTSFKRYLTPSNIIIALTIICAAVSIYFRSVYREQPMMDERFYAYIFEEGCDWNDYTSEDKCFEKVETLSDALQSQINHYKYHTGRFIIHFIEQAFTGVWGLDSFYVINAILFALLLVLTVLYTTSAETRHNPLLWVLTLSGLILFFPYAWRLWVSHNYAPNYLFPSALSVAYLYLFDKLIKTRFSVFGLTAFCVLALVLGASHEAFAISISGSMVIYLLINVKSIFKSQHIFPIIALGLGTMTLLLSPGNYTRLSDQSAGIIASTLNAFELALSVKMIWIAIIATIIFITSSRNTFKQFIKKNQILVCCLVCAILFSCVANTGPYSLTAVELMSFLLVMKMLSRINWIRSNEKISVAAAALIFVMVAFVQVQVVRYGKMQMENYEKAVAEYISNNDGIFRKPIIDKPFYVKPYTFDWSSYMSYFFLKQNLQKDYHQCGKEPRPLIDKEYDALADGSMFTAKNAIPGGSGFYGMECGSGYWARHDTTDINKKKFIFTYKPVHFSSPNVGFFVGIKFALFPNQYPTHAEVDSISLVSTRWGDFYFIKKPMIFEVTKLEAK